MWLQIRDDAPPPKDGTVIFITAPYWWASDGGFHGFVPVAARWSTNAEIGRNYAEGGWWTTPDLKRVYARGVIFTHWCPMLAPPDDMEAAEIQFENAVTEAQNVARRKELMDLLLGVDDHAGTELQVAEGTGTLIQRV